MGGGEGSSTSFLARSTTLQSFPLPLTPPSPLAIPTPESSRKELATHLRALTHPDLLQDHS